MKILESKPGIFIFKKIELAVACYYILNVQKNWVQKGILRNEIFDATRLLNTILTVLVYIVLQKRYMLTTLT